MKTAKSEQTLRRASLTVTGAIAAMMMLAGTAASQQAAPAKPTPLPPKAPAPSAETAAPVAAWVVNCSSGTVGTALSCQISQSLSEKETGRRVLTVTVRKQGAGNDLIMLMALPHGLFLPAGATYQIDDGEKAQVAIQTSDQNGAYAAVPLTAPLIGALKNGVSLKIGMEAVTRKPVSIPLTLAGFTAAIDKLVAVK